MSIHGRLAEYPLSILLEIFLHRGETGLLEISSPSASGSFYLKDGELIDAALGNLRGAEAVRFGATLRDAYFQFNSLSPDEYLRLVWEDSFESSQPLADTSRPPAVIFHSALDQFSAYVSATHRTSKRVLVSLAQQTLSFTKAAGEFTWKFSANLACQLMAQARASTKLLSALRQAIAEWLIALRDYEAPLRKQIAQKGSIIWKTLVETNKNKSKVTISPALLERILPAGRISLGLVIIALLAANLVSQIERRSNNDAIAADPPAATTVGNESQAQSTRARKQRPKRRRVSRGKRNPGVTQSSSISEEVEASAVKQANTSGGKRSIGFRRIAY